MPVATPVLLTSGSSTTNSSSYTTASISPSAGKLILVAVSFNVFSGVTPTSISVSGCGLTWDQAATIEFSGTSTRLSVFRAVGTPSAGTLTISQSGGGSIAGCIWQVVEIGQVQTGSNGASALLQTVSNSTTGNSPNTFNLTLGALSDPTNNGVIAFWTNDVPGTYSPSSGYTELADLTAASSEGAASTYAVPGTTTPGVTQSVDFSDIAGIAFELAYAPNQPTITSQPVTTFAAAGATVTLSVTATASAGSLTYQWQKWNGSTWVDESGQTSSSTNRTAPGSAGLVDAYRVIVTDSNGNTTSNVASIIVPNTKQGAAWGAIDG